MDKEKNIYKTLRQIRGIEITELAEMLNVSAEYIDDVESGHLQPKGLALINYAKALRVTPEFITNRNANADNQTMRIAKHEDYIWKILQDIRKLSTEYDVQVKRPYTHSERQEQYAIYFRDRTDPGRIAFVCFADTFEEAKTCISSARNDDGPYKIHSVKWNTNLQSLRCKKGLTCKQLEKITGISKRQLEYLEGACGRINKTALESAVKLSKALQCHVEELMDPDEVYQI